jgi:hypothetical protein
MLSHGLKVVSETLKNSIGGAMETLYGMLFRGLAKGLKVRTVSTRQPLAEC